MSTEKESIPRQRAGLALLYQHAPQPNSPHERLPELLVIKRKFRRAAEPSHNSDPRFTGRFNGTKSSVPPQTTFQTNSVCPGIATGATASETSQSNLAGIRSSLEFNAWSHVT